MRIGIGIVCGTILAGLAGCQASTPVVGTLAERLQAEDPDVRIQAAVEAANTGEMSVVPLLVDRLSDSDREVRFYAGLALRKLAGEDVYRKMGWSSYDPPEQRRRAVRRWRRWVREHFGDRRAAASQPATMPTTAATTTQPF